MKKNGLKYAILGSLCILLFSSHDMFLKTSNYFIDSHTKHELILFNGTFEKSENSIDRDRIVDPKIVGPGYMFIPAEDDWYDKNDATYLKFTSGDPGTYVAGISTLPRLIDLTADEFNEYLEHDGIMDVLQARKDNNEADGDAIEKYAKHVKTILQVADKRSNDYSVVFGYPVEFIPLGNPYEAKVGDELTFKLLHEGKPLAGQLVYYRNISDQDHPHDHHDESVLRTNDKGEFKVHLDHDGVWYLRMIYMIKSNEKGIDYVSNWATLSFEIR